MTKKDKYVASNSGCVCFNLYFSCSIVVSLYIINYYFMMTLFFIILSEIYNKTIRFDVMETLPK